MFNFTNHSHHQTSGPRTGRPDRFTRVAQPVNAKTPKQSVPSGIQGHLDRLQQILTVVERTSPYIEEYGPLVRNLPQMYRMIKAFKSFEFEDETSQPKENNEEETHNNEQLNEDIKEGTDDKGLSKPKLFI